MLKYILVALVFIIFGASSELAAVSVLPFFFFGLYFLMNVGPSGALVLALIGHIIYLLTIWLVHSRKFHKVSPLWLILSLASAGIGGYIGATTLNDVMRLKLYVLFLFFPFAMASFVAFLKKDFEIPRSFRPLQLAGIFLDAIAPAGNSYYKGFSPLNASLASIVVIIVYLTAGIDLVKESISGANFYLIGVALISAILGGIFARRWRNAVEESFWTRSLYPVLLWFSAYFILRVI